MEKYKNDAERQIAQANAAEKIRKFLTKHASYTELVECHSKAQVASLELMTMVDNEQRSEMPMDDLHEFFYFSLEAIKLLEPFAEEKLYV